VYIYRYINKLHQFDRTEYTLILEDLEKPSVEPIRIQKTFLISPNLIDEEFLFQEAKKEMLQVVTTFEPIRAEDTEKVTDGDAIL